jgi:hypothetical protein
MVRRPAIVFGALVTMSPAMVRVRVEATESVP